MGEGEGCGLCSQLPGGLCWQSEQRALCGLSAGAVDSRRRGCPLQPGGLRQCWGWTPGLIQPGCGERPSGALPGNGCPRAHSSWATCSSCSSQPCFPSNISSLAREPLIHGACHPSHSLNRVLMSLDQELLRAWPAEEKPMSLLGAPSLSGLGQAELQMIQLPCPAASTAQTTHWLPSRPWGQGLPTVPRCLGKLNPGSVRTS